MYGLKKRRVQGFGVRFKGFSLGRYKSVYLKTPSTPARSKTPHVLESRAHLVMPYILPSSLSVPCYILIELNQPFSII